MEMKTTFRRPRRPDELKAVKVTVHRTMAQGMLKQAKLNYYFVPGWFDRLVEKDAWVMKDIFVDLAIKLNAASEQSVVQDDTHAKSMRKVAQYLRGVIESLTSAIEVIEYRAGELEIEDSKAEATD